MRIADEIRLLEFTHPPLHRFFRGFGTGVKAGVLLVVVAIAIAVVIIAAVPALTDHVAHASPLPCESIRNADQRHYCRALSRPQPSECEFIKDHDLRQLCRARSR